MIGRLKVYEIYLHNNVQIANVQDNNCVANLCATLLPDFFIVVVVVVKNDLFYLFSLEPCRKTIKDRYCRSAA